MLSGILIERPRLALVIAIVITLAGPGGRPCVRPLRQREDEFIKWVLDSPPIRLPGAAAIFTAASTGIPLCLTHLLRHNRVLHERVLLISSITIDTPWVEPQQRVRLVPLGAGITRVLFHFGFMETPDVMEGLKLACVDAGLQGIDPENITYYFRRVMVIP